jgi:phytoene desaturase
MYQSNKKNICVIGSGFAGLSAATHLASEGNNVYLLEKNSTNGGRARKFSSKGFTFDMGPSWYWMPDVIEKYFKTFGKEISEYFDLIRLDPSYKVFFSKEDSINIPANYEELKELFEEHEEGSSEKLDSFLAQAKYKYETGINNLVHKPSKSITEFFEYEIINGLFKMDIFKSMHSHIRKHFTNEKLIKLLEFPILFLGATAKSTPALYSLMNYADIKLGTWYPKGGMYKLVEAMVSLAKEKGVKIYNNQEVVSFNYTNNSISHVLTTKSTFEADYVVCGADYNHIDQNVLEKKYRNYSNSYWNKRTLAPSSLLFYVGLNKKLKNVEHHCLFFDKDFENHSKEIYEVPRWPSDPLFYASFSSKTDKESAPKNCENMFLLIPIAPDIEDNKLIREKYFELIMARLEKLTKQPIKDSIIYKKSYCIRDFKKDYNSFKGNAYGLANTLFQTAIFKPSIKNKKLKNLFFCGQLTVPGPGVPPSIISGGVVAKEIKKKIKN